MKYKRIITALIVIFILLCSFNSSSIPAHAESSNNQLSHKIYLCEDQSGYKISGNDVQTTNTSIANVVVNGDINKTTTSVGKKAFGVNDGTLTFSLEYSGKYLDKKNSKTYLISDNQKSVNEIELSSKVEMGALIIQKSYDYKKWTTVGNVVTNVLEDNPKGISNIYTPSGNDLNKGCYYRIFLAYRTRTSQKGFDKKNDVIEVFECFACRNKDIALHNLSVAQNELVNVSDDTSVEVMSKGETLLDGSVTIDGFEIDTQGAEYKISVNGKEAKNGDKIVTPGKYVIISTTKVGDSNTKTIYVYNGGTDNGIKDYFGNSFIIGGRVYKKGDYPSYEKGTNVHINAVSEDKPRLSGTITNLNNGSIINISQDRKERRLALSSGEYVAEFTAGMQEAGTVYSYKYHFNVVNEQSNPCVNYEHLMSSCDVKDLKTAHYEVTYEANKGSFIYVCFSDEDDAFDFAFDIERRYIKTEDGVTLYKSISNPNTKIPYDTESNQGLLKLTEAVNYYAEKNVERKYFDPTKSYTYETFENEEKLLDSLETIAKVIEKDYHVFPSESEKEKLSDSMPYLNGYKYMYVGDYDVVWVEAYCAKDGRKHAISFNKPVDDQLTVSSKYTITEINQYGDQINYDAYYMAQNETISRWKNYSDDKETIIDISSDSIPEDVIEADAIALINATNYYDKYALISISARDSYDVELTCLLSEAKDLLLNKEGEYAIKFIDRVGNSYSLNVRISGNAAGNDELLEGKITFAQLYNSIHLNEQIEE